MDYFKENIIEKIYSFLKFVNPPKASRFYLTNTGKFSNEIVIGGTFDRLHYGHQAFINTAFELAVSVHIGIMSDEGIRVWGRKKYQDMIEPFTKRVKNVMNFLKRYNLKGREHIVRIDDPFSYAVESDVACFLDSILVSSEEAVIRRTRELNDMRKDRGLEPLQIFEIPLITDEKGRPISSTRIRAGESFFELFKDFPSFILSSEVEKIIRKPIGNIARNIDELPEPSDIVIAVGDYVLSYLVNHNYPVSIGIIDRKTRRTEISDFLIYTAKYGGITKVPSYIPTLNERGTISKDSWIKVALAFVQRENVIVRVYGEEDLVGFPAYLLAPKNALVIYGQPPPINAMVYNIIDEEIREEVLNLLLRMKVNI